MIKYYGGSFGFKVILRLHGSAVFKSLTPALLSTFIYLILYHTTDLTYNQIMPHPYPIGALMVAFSFLLTFKMSFSYNRVRSDAIFSCCFPFVFHFSLIPFPTHLFQYWEACGAVYQMHSKWLDVGTEVASFHLQSNKYKNKPPAFGHHPEITSIKRERERYNEPNREELEQRIEELMHVDDIVSLRSKFRKWSKSAKTKGAKKKKKQQQSQKESSNSSNAPPERKVVTFSSIVPMVVQENRSPREAFQRVTSKKVVNDESKQASLFLQETAHLLSLLSAVAMSTLRNDLEGAESPLATFVPGAPWPCVDPDAYNADVRKDWTRAKSRFWTVMQYLFGRTRTGASRTLYNAARPFRVIGGISDAEIQMLQAARGPSAKVALVCMWLQEFLSREYLSGSTGGVAPPIISRLYQFISDGNLGYAQARKIAYIPFPFPHAQITSLFILVVAILIPILMLTFVENEYLGVALNIVTVMCFTGLNEGEYQNESNGCPRCFTPFSCLDPSTLSRPLYLYLTS